MRTKSSSSWKNLDANANITTTTTMTTTGGERGEESGIATTTQLIIMRPNTLNVSRERNFGESKKFIREALNAWRIRAKQNYVPADKLLELFQELKVYPTEEQVNEMLHTAKLFARRSNNFDSTGTRLQVNGITFGEFCVLLADLKRFRTFSITKHDKQINEENSYINNNNNNNHNNNNNNNNNNINNRSSLTSQQQNQQQQHHQINSKILQIDNNLRNDKNKQDLNNIDDDKDNIDVNNAGSSEIITTIKTGGPTIIQPIEQSSTSTLSSDSSTGPEVFLGGSCNPTTWRADVAIPALNDLGISFYNPQVSDWTPDLIELEHRAKEKARVLFFVMDSETRASAGAIEAAHIAGQNARQLVLVLHPYKPQQTILNEPVSAQEYIDLARNQQLLRELVSRRGLPVLDSIPSGLQRTKAILAGNHGSRDQPSNIASRLISVRRAFDRVVGASEDTINRIQCQKALSCLGIPNNILSLDSLNQIINYIKEIHLNSNVTSSTQQTETETETTILTNELLNEQENRMNFDDFCIIAAYLSVMQQEINNSTCISPIKGINVPPPPIFFTNTPEFIHSQTSRCHNDDSLAAATTTTTTINRSNSREKLRNIMDERLDYKLNRDSGTSSPQPTNEQLIKTTNIFVIDQQQQHKNKGTKISVNVEIVDNDDDDDEECNIDEHNINNEDDDDDDDSDSTDSVFSSGSSDELNLLEGTTTTTTTMTTNKAATTTRTTTTTTVTTRRTNNTRDLYLGGSCQLRTRWRQEYIIPYLRKNGITFYLSNLHESINNKTFNYNNKNDCSNPTTTTTTTKITTTTLPHSEKRLKYNPNANDNIIINDKNHDITATIKTAKINNDDNVDNDDKDDDDDDDNTKKNIIKNNNLNLSEFPIFGKSLFNPILLDSSRVLFFFITNETRSLAPMTLAAHYIGLGYNVILCVQMLPDFCKIGNETLTPSAIKDYNRGRAYLIDLAKRQGIPVFNDPQEAIECAIEKVKMCKSRHSI